MVSSLQGIFDDQPLCQRIRDKLPHLFRIAELESSRAGRVGMEVGSSREKVLAALLIYKYGRQYVDTEIPITQSGVDVKLFGEPVSIKTITNVGGVKVSWTVDTPSAQKFIDEYIPSTEILLAQIKWDLTQSELARVHPGGLFWFPLPVQQEVFKALGPDKYLKPPKVGTNPRGIELSKECLVALLQHEQTKCIEILWRKRTIDYDPYKRWVDYWNEP